MKKRQSAAINARCLEMAENEKTSAVPRKSHAREFLANERTFLAWMRTSIAIIGFGFAIVKFDIWITELARQSVRNAESQALVPIPVGDIMIILGGVLAVFGAWRYRVTGKQIHRGEVKSSDWLVFAVSGLVILLTLIIVVHLIIIGGFF